MFQYKAFVYSIVILKFNSNLVLILSFSCYYEMICMYVRRDKEKSRNQPPKNRQVIDEEEFGKREKENEGMGNESGTLLFIHMVV